MIAGERVALIEDLRSADGGPGGLLVRLPDTATSVVFRTAADGRSDLLVVGPRTRASCHPGKNLPVCIKVRLLPGRARPVLGPPVSELADRVTPLAGLWGGSAVRLERRLAGLGGDRGLILHHLQAALRARISTPPPAGLAGARLVAAAAAALSARRPARLGDLARDLAVSERHLRDLLSEGTGLAPKSFTRIARLRSALACGQARSAPLAQIAAATGYYDQSHMTAEFRAMMGVPPAAFFAGVRPAPQPC
jgi:AraC-like DNA-binding protein